MFFLRSQDTDQENYGPDSENLKTSNKYKRLASILSVILTAVSVALIVALTQAHGHTQRTYFKPTPKPEPKICMSDECVTASGTISSYMDLNVDPCHDFYKYTCGKWEDDHPLPAGDLDGWSAFVKLSFESRKYMRQALDNFKPKKAFKPESYKKLYDFYHGCVNKTSRDSKKYSTLYSKLDKIGGWPTLKINWSKNNFNLEHSLIESIKLKHFPLIKIQAIKDWMDNNQTIIAINPSINAERDLVSDFTSIFEEKTKSKFEYFDTNIDFKDVFLKVIEELSPKYYSSDNRTADIEYDYNELTKFYQKLTSIVTHNSSVTYYMENYQSLKFRIDDLSKNFTGTINWHKILTTLFPSANNDTKVFIQDYKYLKNLIYLINETDTRVIANYIGSSFVRRFGKFTTTKLIELLDEKLDAPEVLPNICYDLTETYLPNLLGRLYVDKRFNENGTKSMAEIIDLIQDAFIKSLNTSKWMDPITKEEAIRKVSSIKKNVAYPKWTADNATLDAYYKPVTVDIGDFLSSVLSVIQSSQGQNFKMLEMSDNPDSDSVGPKVIDSWPSHDATYVNAFYYFSTNGIYFPAGIAQDPFFVYNRPMVMNLGSIGMIIGHEMTHSLDTQGRLYNYRGELKDWWNNTNTRQTFLDKSNCFVKQYNKINIPGYKMNVSGNRTLAENIADNGGLRQAYQAFELYKESRTNPFEPLPGKMSKFTEEQLFFISFANMWCSNMFPSSMKKALETGAHSPEPVRVFATLANFDKFSEAFKCKNDARMNPKEKCVLW